MAKFKVSEESLTLGPIDPAVFTGREEEILFSSTTSLFGFSEGGGNDIGEGCLSFQANHSLPQELGATNGTGDGGRDGADTACPKAPSLLQSLNAVINKTASAREARAGPMATVRTIGTPETTNKRSARKTRKAKAKPSSSPQLTTSGGIDAEANNVGLKVSDVDGDAIMTRRRTRSSSKLNRDSRKEEGVVLAVAAGNLPWSPPSPEVKEAQATGPRGKTSDGEDEAIVNKSDSAATDSFETKTPTRGGNENSYGSPKRKMRLRSSGTDGPLMETDRQAPAPVPGPSPRDNTVGVGGMEFIPGFEDTIDLQFMTTLLQGDGGEAILGSAMDSTDNHEADPQGSLGLANILLRDCDTQSEAPVTKSDLAKNQRNNESGERKENSPGCEALVKQNTAVDRGAVSSRDNDATRGVRQAVGVVTVPPQMQVTSQTTPTSTLSPLSSIPLANIPRGCVASSAKPLFPAPEKHNSTMHQKNDTGATPSSQISREGVSNDAITVTQSEKNVSCESMEGIGKETAAPIDGQAGRRFHSGPGRSGPRVIEAMPPPSINGVPRCCAGDMEKNTTARMGVLQRTAVTTPGAEISGEMRHQESKPGSSGRGWGDCCCPPSNQSVLPRVTGGKIGGSIMYTEERPGSGVAAPPGRLPRKVSLRFAPRERSTEEKVAKQGYLPFQKLTAPLSKPLEAVFKFMRKKWREVASSDLDKVRIVCDAVTTVESTEQTAANSRATFVWGTERSGDSLARLVNSLPDAARTKLCKEEVLDLTYTFVSGTIAPPPCDVSSVWDDSSVPAAVPSSAAPWLPSTSTTAATKSHTRSAQSSLSLPSPMPPPAAVKDKTRKRARTVDGKNNPAATAAVAAAASAAASAAAAIAATATGNKETVFDKSSHKRARRAPNEEKTQPKSASGVKKVAPKSKRPGRYPRSIRPTVSLADAVCGRSLVGDSLAARLAEMASRSGGLAGKMFAAMHSIAVADGLRGGQPTDWTSWPPMSTFAATLSAPWLSSAAFSVNNGARSALRPVAVGTAMAPVSGRPDMENPVQKLDEVFEAPAVTDGAETDANVSMDEIIGENSFMAAFGGCDVDLLIDHSPSPSGYENTAGVAWTGTDQEANLGSTDGNADEASDSGKRQQGDGRVEVNSVVGRRPMRQESDESTFLLGAQPTETRLYQRVTEGTNTGGCEKGLSSQKEQIRTVSMSPAAGMTAVLDTPKASVTVGGRLEEDADPGHPTTSSGRAKEVSLSCDACETPHRDSTLASKEAKTSGELRRTSVAPGATQESDAKFGTKRLASHPKPVPVSPPAVEMPCVSSRSEISMHSARSECEDNRSYTGAPSTPQPSSSVGGSNEEKNACASGRVEPQVSPSSGCFQAEPPLDADNSAEVDAEEYSPCPTSKSSLTKEAAAVFAAGVADGLEVESNKTGGISHSDAKGRKGRPSAEEHPMLVLQKTKKTPSPDASAHILSQEAHVTASMKQTPAAGNANPTNSDTTITAASPRASGSTPFNPRSFNAAAPAKTPETNQSCDFRSVLIGEKAVEHTMREQVQASYAEAWSSFPNCCFLEESLARKDASRDAGAGGDAKHTIVGEDLVERWLALPHADVALDGMISISPASTPGSAYGGKGLNILTPTMGGFFTISPRRDHTPVSASSCRSGSCCSDDLRRSHAAEWMTEKTDQLPTLIRLGRSMSKGLTPVKSVKEAADAWKSRTAEKVAIVVEDSLTANGGGGGGDIVNHCSRTSSLPNSRSSSVRKRRNCEHTEDKNEGVDAQTRPKKRSKKARIKPTFVGSLPSPALSTESSAFSHG